MALHTPKLHHTVEKHPCDSEGQTRFTWTISMHADRTGTGGARGEECKDGLHEHVKTGTV